MKRIASVIVLAAAGFVFAGPWPAAAQPVPPPQEDEVAQASERLRPREPVPMPPVEVRPPAPGPEPRVWPPRPPRGPEVVLPPRGPSELHPKWPIQRPPRRTIVRRRRDRDRVPPVVFLPPVFFGGVVIDDWRDPRRYRRDRLSWSDSETLYRDEGWVEVVLDSNARGEKLWFEVRGGRARIEWAEIVFENGETQVVDFKDRSIGPGLYRLLDFPGLRRVDHVRMVAQAGTREVSLTLRMEH